MRHGGKPKGQKVTHIKKTYSDLKHLFLLKAKVMYILIAEKTFLAFCQFIALKKILFCDNEVNRLKNDWKRRLLYSSIAYQQYVY